MRLAYLALPLFALAACSQEPAEEAETPETAVTGPMENATLDLQATGIIVPPQNGFEQLDVPFGSMRAPTEVTLGNVLGEPTDGHDGSGDCALQSAIYPGITVNFRDDEFVGYYAETPFVDALGNRTEMLSDPGVALVDDSTLGEEFAIGAEGGPTISGIFTGAGDDAAVEALWAGENCIAR